MEILVAGNGSSENVNKKKMETLFIVDKHLAI